MSSKEYYLGFYAIFAGVAGTGLVINWVKILKDYPVKKVSWYQLLWSFQFFFLLIWEWYRPIGMDMINSPVTLIQVLISPIVLYAICYLFLPQTDEEYHHALENQKLKIAVLGIIWCLDKYLAFYYAHEGELYGQSQILLFITLTLFLILAFDRSKFTWAAGSIVYSIYSVIVFSFSENSFFTSVIFMGSVFGIYFFRRLKKRLYRQTQ